MVKLKYHRCEDKARKYRIVLQQTPPSPRQEGNSSDVQKNAFSLMCSNNVWLFPFVSKIYEVMKLKLRFFFPLGLEERVNW